MKLLLVLVLAVFAGCDARLLRQPKQSKQQVDLVKDAFWDYVAKASSTAEESLKQIQQSDLGKDINTLIAQSTRAVNQFTNTMRTQVAPLTKDLLSKVSQEAENLKARLQKDLSAVGANLQPYAEEMMSELQRKVEELRSDAVPYAENMDPEALKEVLLQRSQNLKVQLDKSIKQLQDQMVPLSEEVKQKVEKSVEEFQKKMIPMAQTFQAQLTQKTQEIQQNLAPYGEELQAKLDEDAENLRKQLFRLWKSFTKMMQ